MINEKLTILYCNEDIRLIENYNKAIADNTQTWCVHHRNEIAIQKSAQELKDMGLYYNRPADELIFLTNSQHCSLHGKNMSDKTKLKMSNSRKGKHHSDEVRAKISASHKGKHPSYEARLNLSKGQKNRYKSPEEREKASKRQKGKAQPKYRWLTPTGEIAIMGKANAACNHPDWQLIENTPIDPNEKVPLT